MPGAHWFGVRGTGEPVQQLGPPIQLHFDQPFYVGIAFCSHLPDKSDTAVLSNVLLENSSGKFSEMPETSCHENCPFDQDLVFQAKLRWLEFETKQVRLMEPETV